MKKLLKISLILCLTSSVLGQLKPMMGTQVNIAHPLSDFVAFWPMWEGSGNTVQDLSGNGNTGTLTSGVTWVAGKYGPATNYASSTDHIAIAHKPNQILGTGPFTIGVCVRVPVGGDNWGGVLAKGMDTGVVSGSWQWARVAAETDQFSFLIGNDAGVGWAVNLLTAHLANGWHLLVAQRIGSTTSIYVDGIYYNSSATEQTDLDITEPISFGADSPTNKHCMNGDISHGFVYSHALSPSEIALLYREPFCMFEEGLSVAQMYSYGAPPAVLIPVFYYHYINHALLVLPFVPFGLYCYLRRQKCAA